jgi:hypothetical protein
LYKIELCKQLNKGARRHKSKPRPKLEDQLMTDQTNITSQDDQLTLTEEETDPIEKA